MRVEGVKSFHFRTPDTGNNIHNTMNDDGLLLAVGGVDQPKDGLFQTLCKRIGMGWDGLRAHQTGNYMLSGRLSLWLNRSVSSKINRFSVSFGRSSSSIAMRNGSSATGCEWKRNEKPNVKWLMKNGCTSGDTVLLRWEPIDGQIRCRNMANLVNCGAQTRPGPIVASGRNINLQSVPPPH